MDNISTKRDFFISFNKADRAWATWIAWVLEADGYKVWFQDWDFRGNFVEHMQRAHREATRTLAVLSDHYFGSEFTAAEWTARLAEDPAARADLLVPVKVGPLTDMGILSPIVYADLTNCNEGAALRTLLDRVRKAVDQHYRPKPEDKPDFPTLLDMAHRPQFPTLTHPGDDANIAPGEHVTLPLVWHVPYPRNPNFTGRSDVIARLQKELQSGQAAAVTQAIAGLGGIGKTQLALEYCYREASSYRVVWWIRAESKETRMADLAALAERLQLAPVDEPNLSNSVRVVIDWLDRTPGWLMIFDNVERPEDLEHLLPAAGRGHVLITSRHAAWGALAKTVSLNVWTTEESTQYLRKRTDEDDTEANKRAATALAEALGHLPLAIEQAAAYIEESKIGISTYAELFAQHQLRLFEGRAAQPSSAQRTIATVWDISLRSVERASPGAVALLQLCAFMRPDRISKQEIETHHNIFSGSLRTTASDKIALHDAIATLRRYSLVDATPEFISVHRLVQLVVRDRLGPHDSPVSRNRRQT
jgi:TIR domain/NB-ARC domain